MDPETLSETPSETLPEPIVQWQPDRRRNTGAVAIGAAAVGAFALAPSP